LTFESKSEPIVFPVLHTAHLTLRRIELADARDFFAIHADPESMRYWSGSAWPDIEQALRVMASDEEGAQDGTAFRFGIVERGASTIIGCCSLFRIDYTNGRAEVGYILRRSHHGRGIMYEALGAVIEHAFEAMDLRRLEADIDPRNTPSARLLDRLGFTREAHMRARWLVGDEVSDTAFYGLLRTDRRECS
jgi:[ribosomal protein S5]-alanine N-acetyltransferase